MCIVGIGRANDKEKAIFSINIHKSNMHELIYIQI